MNKPVKFKKTTWKGRPAVKFGNNYSVKMESEMKFSFQDVDPLFLEEALPILLNLIESHYELKGLEPEEALYIIQEKLLQEYDPKEGPESRNCICSSIGIYLGHLIIKAVGGKWVFDQDRWPWVELSTTAKVNVTSKPMKFLTNGWEDNLIDFYRNCLLLNDKNFYQKCEKAL